MKVSEKPSTKGVSFLRDPISITRITKTCGPGEVLMYIISGCAHNMKYKRIAFFLPDDDGTSRWWYQVSNEDLQNLLGLSKSKIKRLIKILIEHDLIKSRQPDAYNRTKQYTPTQRALTIVSESMTKDEKQLLNGCIQPMNDEKSPLNRGIPSLERTDSANGRDKNGSCIIINNKNVINPAEEDYKNACQLMTEVYGKKLLASEEKIIRSWIEELHYSFLIVEKAVIDNRSYRIASIPNVDGTLTEWKNANLKTLEEIEIYLDKKKQTNIQNKKRRSGTVMGITGKEAGITIDETHLKADSLGSDNEDDATNYDFFDLIDLFEE